MANETIRVVGLTQMLRATGYAEKATKAVFREQFKKAGEIVQQDAAQRFERYSSRTASNFRTYVRVRGVSVEQRLRKTTGLRPDFGALQMRKALIPALEANTSKVEHQLEVGLDELVEVMAHGA